MYKSITVQVPQVLLLKIISEPLNRCNGVFTLAETEIDTETKTDKIGLHNKVHNCTETVTEAETETDAIRYCIQLHQSGSWFGQCDTLE